MSEEEIRHGETTEVVHDDGERLIQMLSVIASNVDRPHQETADVTYTQNSASSSGTTVVAVQAGQHDYEQMSHLFTTMAVPRQITQSTTEAAPAIAGQPINITPQMEQSMPMVQEEVVVGAQELGLGDAETAITIQTLPATEIALEDVHALQPMQQSEHDVLSDKVKKIVFMTNYRDYTITDVHGRISIGEEQQVLSTEPTCKMMPVTDNTSGHKFEYQYRARGTLKRYESKDIIIFFIGQISNERIRALYYQVIFQLVCKVGKLDLDIDYTSGRKVYSEYYSCFGPSTARTIKSPIEKLTYMKLLIAGDKDETLESDQLLDVAFSRQPVEPSKKLLQSSAFKAKRGRPRLTPTKAKPVAKRKAKKRPVPPPEPVEEPPPTPGSRMIYIPDPDLNAGKPISAFLPPPEGSIKPEIPTPQVPAQILTSSPETPGQLVKRKRGRPRKPRLPDGTIDRSVEIIQHGTSSQTADKESPALYERGSSKRRVKPPSRLSDYYDYTKKTKAGLGDEEEEEDDTFPVEECEESSVVNSDETAPASQPANKLKFEHPAQPTTKTVIVMDTDQEGKVRVAEIQMPASETVLPIENEPSNESEQMVEAGKFEEAQPIEKGQDSLHTETSQSLEPTEKPRTPKIKVVPRPKKKVMQKRPARPKTAAQVLANPNKKRGPGRPRQSEYVSASKAKYCMEVIDPTKLKHPSQQFHRAVKLKKNLCEDCLINHDTSTTAPIDPAKREKKKCPIIHAKRRFQDQAPNDSGSGSCALMSLPSSLSVKVSPATRRLTVCAGQDLLPYTEFGPLVGILLGEDDIQVDTDLSQIWFLQQEEEAEKYFLYTGDENASNWCHYLTPVTPPDPFNTVLVLRDEGIFFTTTEKIPAGSEINVHIPYFGSKTRPVANLRQTECLHCKRSFLTGLDYQKHYHIFHPGGFNRQKTKCRLCGLSFPGMKDLNQHMTVKHNGEGAFLCDQCPRSFSHPARLKVHKQDVHPPPDAAVSCEKCGKIYRCKRALTNHMTNVHSEFKFACEVCGKWFDRRSTLLRHQRLHTGKFKHFCDRCGKGFRDLHNLKVHTLTHSGVRPFSCNFCPNCSFSTRTCLRIHYERFHKLTEDAMPELTRSIPFTLEAYSGSLPPVDKAMKKHIQNKIINVTAQKEMFQIAEPEPASVFTANDENQPVNPGSAMSVMPGESLLKQRKVNKDDPSEDAVQQQFQVTTAGTLVVNQSTNSNPGTMGAPLVIEHGTETVEAEQINEGDHCYYALNVDGQQVLVPATEEVCVIVENDNLIPVDSGNA